MKESAPIPPPTQAQLADAIADATRRAVSALFRQHPGRYYYCSLITTGEGHAPFLSAWSEEALRDATLGHSAPDVLSHDIRWSYADSPFCDFGAESYEGVRALFAQRPKLDPHHDALWQGEWQLRVDAMVAALMQLDGEGWFGRGDDRARMVINVEVMPPDHTNAERALRLNPPGAVQDWLRDAAEV